MRLRQLLELSRRKDAYAVSEVAQRLVTDSEPIIRRVAALALESMVDAATDNVVRGVAVVALEAAVHDTDAKVQATAAKVLVTLKSIAPPPAPAATVRTAVATRSVVGGTVCNTRAPLIVRAENLTRTRGDVCAAFERATTLVAWPSSLSTANAFALRVTLKQFDRTGGGQLRCQVSITTLAQGATLNHISGGASVALNPGGAGNRSAGRYCVDAILENLLVTKVVPALQLASLPSVPSSPSAPAPTPAPSSSTPVPWP